MILGSEFSVYLWVVGGAGYTKARHLNLLAHSFSCQRPGLGDVIFPIIAHWMGVVLSDGNHISINSQTPTFKSQSLCLDSEAEKAYILLRRPTVVLRCILSSLRGLYDCGCTGKYTSSTLSQNDLLKGIHSDK